MECDVKLATNSLPLILNDHTESELETLIFIPLLVL